MSIKRDGTFGVLPAEIATPLVMVLNELLLNSVEHGFAPGRGGAVTVQAERVGKQLHVSVADTGQGLPDDFDLEASERLGLQIVRTLVAGELRGSIALRTRPEGGTEVSLDVPLSRQR